MPEVSTWLSTIPEMYRAVEASPIDLFTRQGVQRLLKVKGRQTQKILLVAGAVKIGGKFLISKENLLRYLASIGEEAIAEEAMVRERDRRIRLAAKLTAMRSQFIRQPKMLVGLKAQECEQIYRRGLEMLPPNIRIEPGRVSVQGPDGRAIKEGLMRLALAMATDEAEFDRIVQMPERPISDSPVIPTSTLADPRGTGEWEKSAGEVTAV